MLATSWAEWRNSLLSGLGADLRELPRDPLTAPALDPGQLAGIGDAGSAVDRQWFAVLLTAGVDLVAHRPGVDRPGWVPTAHAGLWRSVTAR